MEIINYFGKEDLAIVYLAKMDNGEIIEFVESLQPPIPREKKWVLIISVLYGCPIKCLMCDANHTYKGKLNVEEIISQIDYMVLRRFPNRIVPIPKFKIQFARMGEPALNENVLEVLKLLPSIYKSPGLIPCISTIAPENHNEFFNELIYIKNDLYPNGLFQLQFSIHTTDENKRNELIPVKKWDLKAIAEYGKKFYKRNDKKITLNFALLKNYPVDINTICNYFDPNIFLIKITPVNPTFNAVKNNLVSYIDPLDPQRKYEFIENLRNKGYEVILSIGENEENHIGSNCGQYVTQYLSHKIKIENGYKTDEYCLKK
jgi:23S rRNA (adenine2503-C2)-methyltransferase